MQWGPEALLADFLTVARLAGVRLAQQSMEFDSLGKPHRPPTRLPPGKMAAMCSPTTSVFLKIGKIGARSQARYTSQHYRAGSVPSTLAASILKDPGLMERLQIDEASVADWVKANTTGATSFLTPIAACPCSRS